MTRLTVQLLFSRDQSTQPGAILQCDTSGEYFPFNFFDWRDAIHYLLWTETQKINPRKQETFSSWCEIYGYDSDEKFNGDLNEFGKFDNLPTIFTSIGSSDLFEKLDKLDAWADNEDNDDNDYYNDEDQ
jgi:hypothetical protein